MYKKMCFNTFIFQTRFFSSASFPLFFCSIEDGTQGFYTNLLALFFFFFFGWGWWGETGSCSFTKLLNRPGWTGTLESYCLSLLERLKL